MEGWVKRSISIGLGLAFFAAVACTVSAETVAECQNNYFAQRRAGKVEYEREYSACNRLDRQCHEQADARWKAFTERASAESQACQKRVLSQMPAPPPIHWKPGDPSPVAPDGRRYIMSCSGKVLGLYKPGGAVEMELKTHPGNCFPNDNPWPGPGSGGTAVTDHCYEKGTGSWKEYSGGRPSWCDPNR